MRQAGQACAAWRKARSAGPHAAVAWRKARSAGPHAAAAERPGGAGNIFAPCVISGSSTRKRALGGKIRAPCILNRPIAPGNGCMGRGCCHSDLEEHAFRADVARKGAFFAHSAKKGCMRCDSCQPRARGRRNARGGRGQRRARWGRCGRDFPMATTWTTILDLFDGDIEGRGQPGAARRRWRRSGRRAGARLARVGARTVSASVHRWARCIGVGGSYSLKLASIAATRSFSASMSCWFTSSIFCKSEREAFST